MAVWLAVLVDNRELVRLLRVEEGATNVLNLTTMVPDQDRVYVELFATQGSRRQPVHVFHANDIRRGRKQPEIVVSAHARGGEVHASLRIDGELIEESTILMPGRVAAAARERATQRENDNGGWLVFGLLALLLVAVLAGGTWWVITTRENSAEAASRGGSAVAAEREPATPPADATTSPGVPSSLEPSPSNPAGDAEEGSDYEPDSDPSRDPPLAAPALALEAPAPVTVLFDPESAELTPASQETLREYAGLIGSGARAEAFEGTLTLVLTGHTALFGNEESRVALSLERARAVEEVLRESITALLPSATVASSVVGRGGNEPVTTDEALQWQNRRVSVSASYSTQSTESD